MPHRDQTPVEEVQGDESGALHIIPKTTQVGNTRTRVGSRTISMQPEGSF